MDEKFGGGAHERWNDLNPEDTGEIREVTFITGCLMLIPTEVVKKVGLLSEEYFLYTLISYSPYKELARWAKLDVNSKNILKCLLFGSAFGNEYLWYLHAIGMVYI